MYRESNQITKPFKSINAKVILETNNQIEHFLKKENPNSQTST
jgi:hypothetical protein